MALDDSLFDMRTRFQNSLLGKEDTFFILSADCRKREGSSDCLTGKISCRFGNISEENVHNFSAFTDPIFEITFRLKRNGICGFGEASISDDILIYSGPKEFFQEYLASQAYMFLRDMVHRHKHHDPKSDTFLDLNKITQEQKTPTAIKKRVSYNLGKMVITQPQKDEPETIQNSLGILAYLTSFQNSTGITTYDSQHSAAIKASLDAEYSRINLRLTSIRWACGVLLGVYYFLGKIHPFTFNQSFEWTHANVLYLTVLVAIILYMGQITKVFDLRKTKVSMELTRVFPYYKVRTAAVLSATIALLYFAVFKIIAGLQ